MIVKVDPRYFRPTEVSYLQGDITKARTILGWEPKMDLIGLVQLMVQHDIKAIENKDFNYEINQKNTTSLYSSQV